MESTRRTITIRTEKVVEFPCLVYLPEGYEARAEKRWPVILYLHGKDERGSDCAVLKESGLPKYIEGHPIPCIVVAPQCPSDSEWIFHLDSLAALTGDIIGGYRADRSRVYLTGLSMGAIGAWHLGIAYPELFAAIIPISGGTYPFLGYPEAVTKAKDVPIWAFHGMDDPVLPIRLTQVLVDELAKAGGRIRYTYYENTGHDAWTRTYENPEVYDWLLQHSRGARVPRGGK